MTQHMTHRSGWSRPAVGGILYLLLAVLWLAALGLAPSDPAMGESYLIIYVHVPAAFSAFGLAFILFVLSIAVFMDSRPQVVWAARAVSEVGLIMTLLTLVTGSLWGYPTWGTFWTWDARLTTTLILALLYGGYLLLYHALPAGPSRGKSCAVLGVMIFVNVIIVYKSVTWWRTLHQPPSLLRTGGAAMDPAMLTLLLTAAASQALFALWLVLVRIANLQNTEQLEVRTLRAISGDGRGERGM